MKTFRLVPLAVLAFGWGVQPASSQQPPATLAPRVISADYQMVKGPKSTVYRRCVGAGRLGEGLRADWQAQLKTCQEAIGFEYLRCHGLLNDELGVYSEDAAGHSVYNWQYIDMVYDFLLSIHIRPFVEIGFMPEALATMKIGDTIPPLTATGMPAPAPGRTISVFWWKANITPPQSYAKWDALITALVQHWTDRYGADEVKTWYFEIWNEPNIPNFFSPNNPQKRKEEYFELYTHTAKAVRAVNPAYRVGGPAGAGPVWTKDLLAYCAAQQVPIDFISFHAYGLGGGPGGLDVEGHKRLYVSANLDAPSRGAHSQDQIIAQSPFPHLPVELTEWSSSYSNHDPVHDTYFEAPYILEQLKHTETLGAMSYWTFTDIFEESGPPKTPFEGGFGLINLQGIKKAAFFAYQFLHQLGDTELQNTDPRSWVCRDGKGGVQALIFDLTDPRHPIRESDQEFFRRVIIPPAKPPVTLRLTSLPPGLYHLITCRIGYEENDAYTAYLKMGAPSQLSPPQVQQLKSLATGQPVEEKDVTVPTSGQWEEPFSMRENEVVFAKLVPVTSAATTSP